MAAPNGAAVYTSLAPTAGMMINRGVADAIIQPNDNADRYTLPCYIPPTGATASADFNPEVDAAESAGGWRVILVHGFTGGNDGAYQPVPLSEFLNGVSHAKSLGDMWIGASKTSVPTARAESHCVRDQDHVGQQHDLELDPAEQLRTREVRAYHRLGRYGHPEGQRHSVEFARIL